MSTPLKVVLLTTETTHHRYYAWKLSGHFPLQAIFFETQAPAPRFETFHPFEARREAYERDVLLEGRRVIFEEIAQTHRTETANNAETVLALKALSPDVLIVFGAGKLQLPVIQTASVASLNLHGGNPERYRGLDTHLWAIYREDFGNLVTTLHHMDEGLDTGDIVSQTPLTLTRENKLHELRSMNTKACLELSLQALRSLQTDGALPSRRQLQRGAYYSAMPSALKEACVQKFEEYVARL